MESSAGIFVLYTERTTTTVACMGAAVTTTGTIALLTQRQPSTKRNARMSAHQGGRANTGSTQVQAGITALQHMSWVYWALRVCILGQTW